ncbi:MAG: MBL fold metallo-hydrolase [Chloroflexota bacterium]
MYIKFWGTCGSIPTPITTDEIKDKIRKALEGAAGLNLNDETVRNRYVERLPLTIQGTLGGNTPCIELQYKDQLLILDAGSGIRLLGLDLMARGFGAGNKTVDILITHTHWDHIQGFPFFVPAFIPNNTLTFYSPFSNLEERFNRQQEETFFPVPTSYMSASLQFEQLTPKQMYQIGHFRVYPLLTSHPGETYIYRIETDETAIVYATDSEFKRVDPENTKEFIKFFEGSDLLIFDSQYSLTEALDKPDWGHSTAMMGAEFAQRANIKRLALFHHDPTSSDEKVYAAKDQAEAYLSYYNGSKNVCEVLVAYDGLTLNL